MKIIGEQLMNGTMDVEKLPLQNFYTAEEYHQDILKRILTATANCPCSCLSLPKKPKKNESDSHPTSQPTAGCASVQ